MSAHLTPSPFLPCVLGVLTWCGLAAPSKAMVTDSAVHAPSEYDSFVPPEMGATYADSLSGVRIKRLSNAPQSADNAAGVGFLTFVSTEYSTVSPFNRDNRWLILQHQSYFALYDGQGTYQRDLPFAVHAGAEPRWSRHDANVLYFVNGNRLMALDVATGVTSVEHTFTEYTRISGGGEADLSLDGDHFVFAGDGRYIFVYTISTGARSAALDTAGHAFNSLQITSGNGVVIGWIPTGTARFTGIELFELSGSGELVFRRQLAHALGHMDLTRETNGQDVLIWTNSNDPAPLAGCPNGIVKVRLANAEQTCLRALDWSLAVHISAPDASGWIFVETYAPSDPSPASPAWVPYTNEVLQVKLNGTETRRLIHHRSRPVNTYGYQPRIAVSRDGLRLVFTSNYNLAAISGCSTDYTDVFFIEVPVMRLPPLSLSRRR